MDKTKARSVEPIKYKNTQQNKIRQDYPIISDHQISHYFH